MDVEQLKQDVAEGNVSLDRLVDLIVSQQKLIDKLQKQNVELQEKIDNKNPTERLDEQYSEKAEEKRQRKGKKRKRPKPRRKGRISTAEKIAKAERTEKVFPEGIDPEQCKFSHTRVVWRCENERSLLIAYEVYRCGNSFGQPPGVLGRSVYGIEILISLPYQVYCLGLSLDKACKVMSFFQDLQLTKSQADSLLNQLARSWEKEFDAICMLLAIYRTAKQLSRFTLDGVIDEVKRWLVKGRSCFTDQAEEAGLSRSASDQAKDHLLTRIILDVDKPDPEAGLAAV